MITVQALTKKYGPAVDDVTFTASPGRVTGFLGPNGARVVGRLVRAAAQGRCPLDQRTSP
jgi:ABC-type Na+ transport system ATPase subunit NatA